MRTYPLFRVSRSFDRQSWESLSDADTRALFDELGRCWDLCTQDASPIEGLDTTYLSPGDLVEVVVARVEAGEVVPIRLNLTRTLYLRATPRQFATPSTGPLDYALGSDALVPLTRS